MLELSLRRYAWAPFGVFGVLPLPDGEGEPIYTAERPWLGNQRWISCIPAGTYVCAPKMFHVTKHPPGYLAIEVRGVPDRDAIFIHRANRPREVEGCIAVGTKVGAINHEWAVLNSGLALDRLLAAIAGAEFRLRIWPDPPAGVQFAPGVTTP